ncbi:hypothetical protein [Mesorhizobium sp. LNJC394B00]|uniref:hypothetical protein n=1 Tax=Mesorhizobium sp. LNJC394B00 TaxID=1287274 RepID=UPI0003CF1F0A|nr:hypothetical protein [Mesorhizobium sp. LNJC394B00]ESY16955.1 hypothetical protein X750_24755 [Mesorhizobium sp. LNJC394B00]
MTGPVEIPLSFEPPVDSDEAEYLIYEDVDGGKHISWPTIRERLFAPDYNYWPDVKQIEASNGERFKTYGTSGFSLGRYHEFIINPGRETLYGWEPALFRVQLGSSVEASFGYATPLMAFLFESAREKHSGPWSELPTVRIIGPTQSGVEAALISAFRAHFQHAGTWPRPAELQSWWEEEEELVEPSEAAPPHLLSADLEPLRFLNSAMVQRDSTAACVYLYRIIEYYAFFANAGQMSTLRHDKSVSDTEFSRKMLDMVFKDERAPIYRLVNTLADRPLLDRGVTLRVIAAPTASSLGEAIYSFRNAIVHGKYGSGFAMHSDPVLEPNELSLRWRPVLLELANRAIDHFGTRS